MEKLIVPGIFLFAFLYIFYRRWVFRDKDDKGPKLTGPATVKSRRVGQGNYQGQAPTRYQGNTRGNWNYFVTFTLSDGEEIELYAFESEYRALKEGISGQLTWQGKQFLEFDTDDE
jgi:hypothetical protein